MSQTEIPIATVPLNDKGFWLQLFPGEGKEVYKPKDTPKRKRKTPPPADMEKAHDSTFWSFGKKDAKARGAASPLTCTTSGESSSEEEQPRKKQVRTKSDNLKWTVNVMKSVVEREREDEKKAAMRRLRELQAAREAAEGHHGIMSKKNGEKKEKKTVKIGLPFGSSDSEGESEDEAKKKADDAERKRQEELEAANKGPKLLELASEYEPDISPLDNGIDYRLDNENNVEYWRERFTAFVATQFQDVSTGLPPKVNALSVQAPRARSKGEDSYTVQQKIFVSEKFRQKRPSGSSSGIYCPARP